MDVGSNWWQVQQRQLDDEKAQQAALHTEIEHAQEMVKSATSDVGALGVEMGSLTCCSRAALEMLNIKGSPQAAADVQSGEVLAMHRDAALRTDGSLRHFEAKLGRMYADMQGLFRWNCAIQVLPRLCQSSLSNIA